MSKKKYIQIKIKIFSPTRRSLNCQKGVTGPSTTLRSRYTRLYGIHFRTVMRVRVRCAVWWLWTAFYAHWWWVEWR